MEGVGPLAGRSASSCLLRTFSCARSRSVRASTPPDAARSPYTRRTGKRRSSERSSGTLLRGRLVPDPIRSSGCKEAAAPGFHRDDLSRSGRRAGLADPGIRAGEPPAIRQSWATGIPAARRTRGLGVLALVAADELRWTTSERLVVATLKTLELGSGEQATCLVQEVIA